MPNKFKKVYYIYYSPWSSRKHWRTSNKTLWIISSHEGKSVTVDKDPNGGFTNMCNFIVDDDKYLFSTKKQADEEARKRNEAGIKMDESLGEIQEKIQHYTRNGI